MNGGDTDDFIEIVAPVGTNMSSYGILLANGSNATSYDYVQLSGIISSTNENNGFGFFILTTDQSTSIIIPSGITNQSSGFASIQNGDPDGILLLNSSTGSTIHGIWYDELGIPPTEIIRNSIGSPPGSGPYSMVGVDVVSIGDDPLSSAGNVVAMNGSGNSGSWEFIGSTVGNLNTNQTALPVELSSFTALAINNQIHLSWTTATEVNNYGFEVERAINNPQSEIRNTQFIKIGFVKGYGNSNSIKEYSFIDNDVSYGSYLYRLKQIDTDGKYEYSQAIETNLDFQLNYVLEQNYPNPFNPVTKIKYKIPETGYVTLKIFDMLGNEFSTLVEENQPEGIYEILFDAAELSSGIYFYHLKANHFNSIKKLIIIK